MQTYYRTAIFMLVLILHLAPAHSQTLHYPSAVISFSQGLDNTGSPVLFSRSNPVAALGAAQNSDASTSAINYVSLGFGGQIILKFSEPIPVYPSTVITMFETTYGYQCNTYPEIADVFVSNNGVNYSYVGQTCGNSNTVLSLYSVIDSVKYLKVVDASLLSAFTSFANADAYDLDGAEIFTTSPLAIELTKFEVTYSANGLTVVVETGSESNSSKLHFQYSPNAYNFFDLFSFDAYGYSSTRNTYLRVIEFHPTADFTYFRIVEEDGNGILTPYNIVGVKTPIKPTQLYQHYDILGREVPESNKGFYFRIER